MLLIPCNSDGIHYNQVHVDNNTVLQAEIAVPFVVIAQALPILAKPTPCYVLNQPERPGARSGSGIGSSWRSYAPAEEVPCILNQGWKRNNLNQMSMTCQNIEICVLNFIAWRSTSSLHSEFLSNSCSLQMKLMYSKIWCYSI